MSRSNGAIPVVPAHHRTVWSDGRRARPGRPAPPARDRVQRALAVQIGRPYAGACGGRQARRPPDGQGGATGLPHYVRPAAACEADQAAQVFVDLVSLYAARDGRRSPPAWPRHSMHAEARGPALRRRSEPSLPDLRPLVNDPGLAQRPRLGSYFGGTFSRRDRESSHGTSPYGRTPIEPAPSMHAPPEAKPRSDPPFLGVRSRTPGMVQFRTDLDSLHSAGF